VVLETHLVPSLLSVVVIVADSVHPTLALVASGFDVPLVPSVPPKINLLEPMSIFLDSKAVKDVNLFILQLFKN
jgi:hypothetical protein